VTEGQACIGPITGMNDSREDNESDDQTELPGIYSDGCQIVPSRISMSLVEQREASPRNVTLNPGLAVRLSCVNVDEKSSFDPIL
jgi:hypothetical protein